MYKSVQHPGTVGLKLLINKSTDYFLNSYFCLKKKGQQIKSVHSDVFKCLKHKDIQFTLIENKENLNIFAFEEQKRLIFAIFA